MTKAEQDIASQREQDTHGNILIATVEPCPIGQVLYNSEGDPVAVIISAAPNGSSEWVIQNV